jgi:hypothetical protein
MIEQGYMKLDEASDWRLRIYYAVRSPPLMHFRTSKQDCGVRVKNFAEKGTA